MSQSTEPSNLLFAAPVEERADRALPPTPEGASATDGKPTRHERLLDRRVALALAAFSLGIVVALLKAGVNVTLEDGYYYFKIAQNLAHGEGSTFDGLHPTNGYHPLWLFCLVPIFRLQPSPGTALALGTLLQGLLMAVGAVVLYLAARRTLGRQAASLSALLWLRMSYPLELSGLEYSLHALGLLMAAYLYVSLPLPVREKGWGVRCYLMLGLTLSLTFLARLETILLAGILGLSLCWRERQAGWTASSARRMLALVGPVAAVCALYVGANVWLFGHPLSVSSSIKRDWSAYLLARDPLYRAHGWVVAKLYNLVWPLRDLHAHYPLAIGAFGVPLLFVIAHLGREPSPWRARLRRALQPYGPFVFFSALQFLAAALLYHDEMSFTPWYYAVQPWLTAVLAGIAFEEMQNLAAFHKGKGEEGAVPDSSFILHPSSFLVVVLAFSWCVPPIWIIRSVRQWQERTSRHLIPEPLQTAARWIRSHLPPEAVVGSWNAGTIGYLSQRRVVNLDGLVNSWKYYRSDRSDLCGYWQRNHITYLVDAFDGLNGLTLVPTHNSYARCQNRLERVWEDTTVWKDDTYVWSGDGRPAHWRMAAYRIRPIPP